MKCWVSKSGKWVWRKPTISMYMSTFCFLVFTWYMTISPVPVLYFVFALACAGWVWWSLNDAYREMEEHIKRL